MQPSVWRGSPLEFPAQEEAVVLSHNAGLTFGQISAIMAASPAKDVTLCGLHFGGMAIGHARRSFAGV